MKLRKVNDQEFRQMQMLEYLRKGSSWSVKDYARIFKIGIRTIYRDIVEIRSMGYKIELKNGTPVLGMDINEEHPEVVYLSDFEIEQVHNLLNTLDQGNPLRVSLSGRFGILLKDTIAPYLFNNEEALHSVSEINYAIHHGYQMVIRGYRSSHSGTVSDRLVEPFAWSENYRQVYAYDLDKEGVRCFVVARMESVHCTTNSWEHWKEHVVPEIDCFWMSGEPREVTLRMSLMALNLLQEEYPLSRRYEVRETDDERHPYEVTLTVRSDKGVGRFVRGLGEENVQMENGERKNDN